MGLETYRKKRDFTRTREPSGGVRASGKRLIFVVHEHHATRLHYDVRLEMDGVLASWAVPKGPSLDPAEKRLAVHVEDHPLAYATFKGVIPEGGYGAGRVYVWDKGVWHPEGDPVEGVRKGRLKFRLEGSRLEGRWTLVRMGGRAASESKENWLLIKERDEFAQAGHAAETIARATSVGRAPSRAPTRTSSSKSAASRASAARARPRAKRGVVAPPKSVPPDFVPPQLATSVEKAPDGDEWIHEIKLDGYRLLCRVEGGKARLLTRSGLDWTTRFPAVAKDAGALAPDGALLDGELVVLDDRGVSQFGALQDALANEDTDATVYFAFDLLHDDGESLLDLPLLERKAALARRLGRRARGRVRYLDHVAGEGTRFLGSACEHALEGVISKRAASPYRSGRGGDWVKSKCMKREELVIAGYTDPTGAREGLGALVLATRDEKGALRYAGRVGTGFSETALRTLTTKLAALETKRPPFARLPAGTSTRSVHWVRPELVAQVTFLAWTRDGLVRQATLDGLREDKPAREVVAERPLTSARARRSEARGGSPRSTAASERPPNGATAARAGEAIVAGVRVSHPERRVYGKPAVTKGDLARYYEAVAAWALPHLAGRPLSLLRCPRGEGTPCFFQKHTEAGPHLRGVSIGAKAEDKGYVAIDDVEGLVTLVQMGVMEIHPWASRVESLESPDRLTIDLDPAPEISWKTLVRAAHRARDELAALGLTSFVKTTGGKGLHVVAPLAPASTWEDVKRLARTIAERLVEREPGLYVAKIAKALRPGRILVDWLRNMRGATAVGAYSTRARPGAPVATPVAWDELSRDLRAHPFSVATLPRRLSRLGTDPWKGFGTLRQSISSRTWKALGLPPAVAERLP